MTVAVVGGINQDVVIRAGRRPAAGETAVGEIAATVCGGKGANQAVAAAVEGAPVRMIGAVGADEAGRVQLAALRAHGVDTGGVAVLAGQATGLAIITLTPDGENSILVGTGANAGVCADAVAEQLDRVPAPVAVIAQCEVGAAPVEAAAAWCRRHGARLVLSLAPVIELSAQALAAADPLVVNAGEAAELLGAAPADTVPAAREHALRLRQRLDCGSVVLTLGGLGSVVTGPGGSVAVPAIPTSLVDTTGAGDAFCGALTAALAAGSPLPEAAGVGAAAASAAVSRMGARPARPNAADVPGRGDQ